LSENASCLFAGPGLIVTIPMVTGDLFIDIEGGTHATKGHLEKFRNSRKTAIEAHCGI